MAFIFFYFIVLYISVHCIIKNISWFLILKIPILKIYILYIHFKVFILHTSFQTFKFDFFLSWFRDIYVYKSFSIGIYILHVLYFNFKICIYYISQIYNVTENMSDFLCGINLRERIASALYRILCYNLNNRKWLNENDLESVISWR